MNSPVPPILKLVNRSILSSLFFLLPVCGVFGAKTAEEIAKDVAPLVDESTFLVGYLDVSSLDPAKVVDRGATYLRRSLELFAFDDESVQRSMTEGEKLLGELAGEFLGPLRQFRETCGIDELYLIGLRHKSEFLFFWAMPLGSKTAESLQRDLREFGPTLTFRERSGFLLIPATRDSDVIAEFDVWLEGFQPAEQPKFATALALREGDPLRLAVLIPPRKEIDRPLRRFAEEYDMMPQAANVLLTILGRLDSGVVTIDPLKPELNIVLQAKNVTAAKQMGVSLESAIELGVTALQTFLFLLQDSYAPNEDLLLSSFFLEIFRGGLRMFLPDREDDKLFWSVGLSPETLAPEQAFVIGFTIFLGHTAIEEQRIAALTAACSHNRGRIVDAFHTYHERHSSLPPEYSVDQQGNPLHGWRVLILPYLDEEELFGQIKLDEPWDSEHNKRFHRTMPAVFKCPSGASGDAPGLADYYVVSGEETAFFGSATKTFNDFTAPLSQTIALVEWHGDIPSTWMDPTLKITFEEACKGSLGDDARVGEKVIFFDGTTASWPDFAWRFSLRIAGYEVDDEESED